MPAKRNIDRVLDDLERRMGELEAAREAEERVMHRLHSAEDIIEIFVGLLAYVCEGAQRRFIDFVVANHSMEPEQASALAALAGEILQERLANGEPIMRPG